VAAKEDNERDVTRENEKKRERLEEGGERGIGRKEAKA